MFTFLNKYKALFISILIIVFGISIDQITKQYALNTIQELERKTNYIHHHIKVFNGFNIVLVYNKGVSFGILNNNNKSTKYILTSFIIMITVFIGYLIVKSKNLWETITYSLIFTGAIGNIIDRFRYGAVVDFLDFYIKDYHWPAFNIADSLVVIGVILVLIVDFISKKIVVNK